MPIPQIPVTVDIAAAAAIAIVGYVGQEFLISHKKLRSSGFGLKPERRRLDRATEVGGTPSVRQAADLSAAIDTMVNFIDGPAAGREAKECAAEVSRLVPEGRRGPLTLRFLQLVDENTDPTACQEYAEYVCVQMAIELRAIKARAQPVATLAPGHADAKPPVATPVLEPGVVDFPEPVLLPQRQVAPRSKWARAEDEIQHLSSDNAAAPAEAVASAPARKSPRKATPKKTPGATAKETPLASKRPRSNRPGKPPQ